MKKSFTLIEILVVIVVIGILSAFIIVGMSSISNSANIAKGQAFSNSLRNSLLLNLISEWKFNESSGTTASDSWGINNGTLSGAVIPLIQTSGCVSNNCLSFNGSSSYVDCGNNVSLDVTASFTIEMWIKRNAVSVEMLSLLRRDSGDDYALFSNAGQTSVCVRFKDTLSAHHLGTVVTVPTGQWSHLVGLYDGRYLKFYLNGVMGSSNDIGSFTVAAGTNNLIIGRNDYNSNRIFNGLMDEVRVYSAAISSSQIKNNYFIGLSKLYKNNGITLNEFDQRIVELKINMSENE